NNNNRRRNLATLNRVGNGGLPTEVFPLQLCQGDCDNDGECDTDAGLKCYQRSANEPVYGCDGTDATSTDFCFDPTGYLWKFGNNGLPAEYFPLQECQGDCDSDAECDTDAGLICFERNGYEPVPGCDGIGISATDYCAFPPVSSPSPTQYSPSGYSESYLGICENSNEPYDLIKMEGLYTDPLEAPDACATYCDTLSGGMAGYVGFTTKASEGQCSCHFDDGSMPNVPSGAVEVSSRTAVGPVTDGNGDNRYECFPYSAYKAATLSPTPSPTRCLEAPCPLENVGNNGLPEEVFPLGPCLGDCDRDAECQPGLYCFLRDANEFADVPGCTGGSEDASGDDFCFDRPANYLWRMGNNGLGTLYHNIGLPISLGVCEGDCDNDSECDEGLKCFSRDGDESVPGCEGPGRTGDDYCFAEENPTASPSKTPTAKPTNGPTKTPTLSPSVSPTTAAPTDAPTLNEVASIFDEESYVSVFGCNSPNPNMPHRAIDGSTNKYICDRTGLQGGESPGIIVIPSHNKVSIAKALRVYSHNDCSGCDPVTYSLEGRSDPDGSWTGISSGDLSWIGEAPSRNSQGQDVVSSYEAGDANLAFAEVLLSNNIEHLHYKLTFQATRESNSNSLQFAEVELAGVMYQVHEMDIAASLRMESESSSTEPFVQAISCPSIGSSKVTASSTKIVSLSDASTFCGIFIQTSSGGLIPYARSYNGYDWESSPGPLAASSDSISYSGDDCIIMLPDLEDTTASYVVLAKDGASSDVRKDIARFLEMTTFGTKISEIDALDTGYWDDTARASYVREQMDMPKTSHREYFRQRANRKWDATTQMARSDHPCSPNSTWRRYSFTPFDQYNPNDGAPHTIDVGSGDWANLLTFETVPEDDTSQIYEADDEGDAIAHGNGAFKSDRHGNTGSGYYDFGSFDFLEFDINMGTDSGTYPLSFRYSVSSSSYNGNRPCQLFINDEMISNKYDFKYTGTKNYWMYSELLNVDLSSGSNRIKIVAFDQSGGPDIDHLRLGKPAAVVIYQNGHARAIAKNGLHLLDDFEYEFTDQNVFWADEPYPPLGDLYMHPYGRAEIQTQDGPAHLDTGNLPVDFTGYEQYLPENYFTFDEDDIFAETSSNLLNQFLGLRGNELLLQDGYHGPICDLIPPFAENGDVPVFGRMIDGSYVQWTPKAVLEENGPSMNDDPGDMASNVLSDGGSEWSNKTGGVMKCSNVGRSFVNEETCFLSNGACPADGVDTANGNNVIVCGSHGEVANDPSLPEAYGIETEIHEYYKEGVTENQKTTIWTEIALYKPDQIRQRMAWALSQIVTTVPDNIDGIDMTEIHCNFYDIFVRHGLGNYRDILREASYSPLMAEHLTYDKSKSTSYLYKYEDKRQSNADENYAREIMQLFSIGLTKLNDDGTPVLDPVTGNSLETYTNEDIVSFARSWTGFSRRPVRGNNESRKTGSADNRLDPLKVVAEWRDPFPKTNLKGGFIGDGYMLCTDLPPQPFLKKGAKYRLLGSKSMPELMMDSEELADDAAHSVSRVELASGELYDRLYNGGNYELTVELEADLACTPDTVECKVETVRVVKVGPVYYEYVERACVQMAFYNNGKQVQLRTNTLRGAMCANADLTVAREACCRQDSYYEVRSATKETDVTHFYEGERMTYATALERCLDYGSDLCVYESVSVIPSDDAWREHGYHWTNKECGINVKVNSDGYIAIVHDAMSTYEDTIPWLVEEENSMNWFKVHWEGSGDYPGSSDINTCETNGCKHMTTGHCLCKTIVTESIVFTDTTVSKEDVMGQLFIGAYGPGDSSAPTDLENGVTVHIVGSNVDEHTVFEVQDNGQTMYLKNVLSTASLEGWTLPPQIYEAEDATISNAIVRGDNTDSATGGLYAQLSSGVNASTYVSWEVEVPATAEYEISLRYALDHSPLPLSVFVNTQEVLQLPSNPNTPIPLNSFTTSSPLPSSLDRCYGDCDSDVDCAAGLFCMQNNNYESVPGCSIDESITQHGDCPLCQKKGTDYCVDLDDFDYGFTLTPTGGWDDDWHISKPLTVNLIAGSNTIRVQIPPAYTKGPNIDHLIVKGASATIPSKFRNPPHFMSLIPSYNSNIIGEQTVRDAQYETEAVIDAYFYHDNVAPFICVRIMQRFGFSNPSGRYVASCVEAFRTGTYLSGGETFGSGEYGSLEAMAASILLDREATDHAVTQDPSHGSMREPILKVTNLMRSMDYQTHIPLTLDGPLMQTSYSGAKLWDIAKKIGSGPFDFPSVFSYYLPGYTPKSGPMAPTKLVSPETSLITMPNVAKTLNGMFSLIKYGLGDCHDGLSTSPGFNVNCVDDGQYENSYGHLFYQPAANMSPIMQAEELSLLLTGGRLADDNISKIVNACSPEPDTGSQLRCMQQLVLTSGEFHSTNEVLHSGEDRVVAEPLGSAATSAAEPEPYKAIVYFYLDGGMDSYNMLAPYSCSPIDLYDNYRKVRGQSDIAEGIGLPLSRLLEIPANNADQPCQSFGMHEELGVLRDLYMNNELTFIANAGLIPEPLTRDNYQTGKMKLFAHDGMSLGLKLLDIHDEYAGTGVCGRMLDVLTQAGKQVNAFSLKGEEALLVGEPGEGVGPYIVSGDGLSALNEDPSIENMNDVILAINNASTADSGLFAEQWSSKLCDIFVKNALLKSELDKTSLATSWSSDDDTSREFQIVTRIMQTREARGVSRDIFFIRMGGFDTHQLVDSRLTGKFTTVNNAIGDFVAEVKALNLWESTVVVQFSEFGRTLDQNSNDGADHGWGGHHFMLGGSVKGGRVLGEYLSTFEPGPENELMLPDRGRVIPKYPWDAMWKGTAEWFGVPAAGPDMEKVLPMHNNFPDDLLYGKEQLFNMLGTNGEESTS
ncbi:hypothetical protein ACHAXR_012486, partial [Thalassiosira sp. AJA248-18]